MGGSGKRQVETRASGCKKDGKRTPGRNERRKPDSRPEVNMCNISYKCTRCRCYRCRRQCARLSFPLLNMRYSLSPCVPSSYCCDLDLNSNENRKLFSRAAALFLSRASVSRWRALFSRSPSFKLSHRCTPRERENLFSVHRTTYSSNFYVISNKKVDCLTTAPIVV